VIEDDHVRWAFVSGVTPAALWAAPTVQAIEAFERAEAALRLAGLDFRHVFRTWVFVDDILDWYDEFNRARTGFYRDRRVFDGLVPASTGIGAANPLGAALTLDLLAVAPKDDSVSVKRLASPLQCPALDYGSSFSRAVEITEPGLRRVLVSGTAGIAPDGTTAHVADVGAQTDLTLDVVEAILRSRGMDWPDVTRAVAYFRRGEDAPVLDERWASRGGPDLPVIVTESVICRDELLFEIEVDAARKA
jgi:enamine deaminase RidA (YjgF/YER057c/UK114 family)